MAAYGLILPTPVLRIPKGAASTFMPHYYQGGEVLHLSSGRYWREIRKLE